MTQPILNDTICAISTPQGKGAIAVIRLSGTKSFEIVNEIFSKNICNEKTHSLHHGTIRNRNLIIDDVVVSIFKNPHSYTGEDVVEITCHASSYIQRQIIQLLIEKGAIAAKAGEFTIRAFLNGKMDLSQAEAVAELISSESEAAHIVALQHLRGGVSKNIQQLRHQFIHFASLIELELDFSEEDVEFANRQELKKLLTTIHATITSLLDSFQKGNVIKNGISVVIVGKPNVGKSTLLNVLLNEEKAIVTDIPGTTRDAIEDVIHLNGIAFRFIDTAGIRETSDVIEKIGVHKTFEKIKTASVVMYLFDVNTTTTEDLVKAKKEINNKIKDSNTQILLIANKIDLATNVSFNKKYADSTSEIIYISAKAKKNINQLKETLILFAEQYNLSNNEIIITQARHYEALRKTEEAILQIQNGLEQKISIDFLSIDIKKALHHLGAITGEVANEDILNSIFSTFCIGK